MDIALVPLNSDSINSSSIINIDTTNTITDNNSIYSTSTISISNRNTSDIENNINDSTIARSSRRIDNDNNVTLLELVREDRNLLIFLMILGYYIHDNRNTLAIKILARTWQCCLLLFGGIGFIWTSFICGGYYIRTLHRYINSTTATQLQMFIKGSTYMLL